VVEILGFYHPAVWWVSSRIRIERENCCDDLAVQVCGNSLQYAKALTYMEEIRHSRTDLALAASGGSLMARIARLLGRPVVDDRRFAWLPGLIALLLVVGIVIPAALVLGAPDTPPATPYVNLEKAEAHVRNTDAITAIERSPQDHVADSNETQVRTDWVIAMARTETVLDRDTLRRIDEILAGERPQIARELAATGQKTTLGQVLKTYVARQSLSQETGTALIGLLKALDLTTKQARPSMTATDGRQFQLRTISEAWFFSSHRVRPTQAGEEPNLIRIEYGTIITGTARAENDASITLDMAVSSSEPEPRADPNDLPVVHRMATSTTVNVPGDRYFSLLVESPNRETRQAEEVESLLVMVKPSVARPAPRPNDSPAAPTRQDGSRPRHVLLDARVIEIERGNLLNLGVAWSLPTIQARGSDGGGDWTKAISIGHSADSTFTKSLLAALNLLAQANQAEIVSNPQVVTLDGRAARLQSIQQEWFLMSDSSAASGSRSELQSTESGTILDITPRVGDSNEITLEVSIEVSNSVPQSQLANRPKGLPSDLPIITRRQAKNSVTVMNGGTVALAGLTSKQDNQTTRTTAIFVTATLVPEVGQGIPSSPQLATPTLSVQEQTPSQAWTIMRYPSCPPLLLGLTQQFAKVLSPSRQNDPVWKDSPGGGTLRLKIDVEGEETGNVIVGLFADPRWLAEPVAIRRVAGSGEHVLSGLPAGRYQIGAMVGKPPVAKMLGVQRQWPQAVEIAPGRTATAEVLVSQEFQQWASDGRNESIAKDYLGDWSELDQSRLLQGRLLGPDGRPIRFGKVQVREYKDPAQRQGGIAAPDVGTSEMGYYRFDGMSWPYTVSAMWRDPMPSVFGYRSQFMRLSRVMEGPQQVDFHFKPFPTGTAKVAGCVTNNSGQPIKGFFLHVMTPPMPTKWSETMDGKYETYVNFTAPFFSKDGRFEMAGLPDGPARVYPVACDGQRYEVQWGRETILAADNLTVMDFELVRPKVRTLYGRVLFEDGMPAVPQPAPWPDATTRIVTCQHTFPVRRGASADLDADGYFAIELLDNQYEPLANGEHQLSIGLPNPDRRGWRPSGEFPFDKLAEDKSKAGVVTVKRLPPTPRFSGELGPGSPLPPGWSLTHDPGKQRMQQVLFNAQVLASNLPNGRPGGDEELVIYDPNAKEVSTFKSGTMMEMPKAQQYRLIGRHVESERILHGPYLMDMTQPGFYKLTVDLGTSNEADSKSQEPNAPPTQLGVTTPQAGQSRRR
jgi:hypothetical protein